MVDFRVSVGFLIGGEKVVRAFPLLLKLPPRGHHSPTSQLGQPCLSLVGSAIAVDPAH